MGVLEDLRFDPRNRQISFKARLSVGQASLDGETWEPTRDLFQFSGTLFPEQVSGDLIHADVLQPGRPARSELVKLYRSREQETAMQQPATLNEWNERTRRLLQRRGPRW